MSGVARWTAALAWLTHPVYVVAGMPMSWGDIAGFLTGIVNVWLAARAHVWNFHLGIANAENCDRALPVLTLQNKTTGAIRRVCDMGRGGNGVWADLAKFRVAPLRGLAAKAPYFHDGQAKNIRAAIRYHEDRFNIDLTHGKRKDLEAFLGAL